MHLSRILFSIYFIVSTGLASPTVDPLPSSVDPICCVYARKLKRCDGELLSHYYPEGEPHIPGGTSPNKILPRDILKREEDFECACAAVIGTCTASCGNCTVSCSGIACATSCPRKEKEKKKKKRNFGPDVDPSSTVVEIEKRDPSPAPDRSSTAQKIKNTIFGPKVDPSTSAPEIEKRDPKPNSQPSTDREEGSYRWTFSQYRRLDML